MQQSISHQMMGYDRASTMFSPDGRLLQVEYAKKTVKQGTSVLGIVTKEGVIIVADKRIISKLIVSESVEKIFQVDDHMVAAASGIVSDGRLLIERAQVLAQQHKVTYDEPVDIITVVKEICNLKQAYTQYGGARPFGVSLLFGGVDTTGARLFMTDPTGIFLEYKATAIGEGEDEINDILTKEFKENMTLNDGLRLGVSALKRVLGKEFNLERIDAVFVDSEKKEYRGLSKDFIRKVSK